MKKLFTDEEIKRLCNWKDDPYLKKEITKLHEEWDYVDEEIKKLNDDEIKTLINKRS